MVFEWSECDNVWPDGQAEQGVEQAELQAELFLVSRVAARQLGAQRRGGAAQDGVCALQQQRGGAQAAARAHEVLRRAVAPSRRRAVAPSRRSVTWHDVAVARVARRTCVAPSRRPVTWNDVAVARVAGRTCVAASSAAMAPRQRVACTAQSSS